MRTTLFLCFHQAVLGLTMEETAKGEGFLLVPQDPDYEVVQKPSCHHCGQTAESLKKCCKDVFFCDETCQKAAWGEHKQNCPRAKKAKTAKPSFGGLRGAFGAEGIFDSADGSTSKATAQQEEKEGDGWFRTLSNGVTTNLPGFINMNPFPNHVQEFIKCKQNVVLLAMDAGAVYTNRLYMDIWRHVDQFPNLKMVSSDPNSSITTKRPAWINPDDAYSVSEL